MTPAGFPHSDIPGSLLRCQLPRAYRRLARPSSAPDAKASTECAYSLAVTITSRSRSSERVDLIKMLALAMEFSRATRSDRVDGLPVLAGWFRLRDRSENSRDPRPSKLHSVPTCRLPSRGPVVTCGSDPKIGRLPRAGVGVPRVNNQWSTLLAHRWWSEHLPDLVS